MLTLVPLVPSPKVQEYVWIVPSASLEPRASKLMEPFAPAVALITAIGNWLGPAAISETVIVLVVVTVAPLSSVSVKVTLNRPGVSKICETTAPLPMLPSAKSQ